MADMPAASVLSDGTIMRLVREGRINIDPWDESMVQPASVDLRLGDTFRVFHNHRVATIDLRDPPRGLTEEVKVADEQPFVIHPGEVCLGSTAERVELPDDIVARIEGKGSLGRLGLIVHATAGPSALRARAAREPLPGPGGGHRKPVSRLTIRPGCSVAATAMAAFIDFRPTPRAAPSLACAVLCVASCLLGPAVATAATNEPALVTSFRLTHTSFQVARARTPIFSVRHPVPRGSAFKFRLTAADTVYIRIDRRMHGRRIGARCLRATRGRRGRAGCTRILRQGTLRQDGRAGSNTNPFSGRLGAAALEPGRYQASITVAVAAGQRTPAPSTARFTILPG